MIRFLALLLLIPMMMGCAALSHSKKPLEEKVSLAANPVESAPAPVKPALKKPLAGVLAGKTDFRGLLRAPYVRLLIVSRTDPDWQIDFYVGSKDNLGRLPWEKGRMIEPGYFTLTLPPGSYKITQIAIPVGTTIASEDMELDFEIAAGKVSYAGTLDVEGTREKVKFGGVPFIRPGFAYTLEIKDEFEEAREPIAALLENKKMPIEKDLFKVITASGGELPPSELLRPNKLQ